MLLLYSVSPFYLPPLVCSHFRSLAGLVLWYVILLFFAYLLHIRDITDDVERCAEMAGAGRNVEWIVSQKGNEKISRWSLFVNLQWNRKAWACECSVLVVQYKLLAV